VDADDVRAPDVTAFWAGGLAALLLVVFPTGDPARIWPAVSRYSNIMDGHGRAHPCLGADHVFRLLSGNIKGMCAPTSASCRVQDG